MAQPQPSAPAWLPYIGLFIAIAGMIYQAGVLSGAISQNERRITKLEALMSVQTDTINKMDVRGAGNQAKLDFLVDQAQKDHRR